MAELQTPLSAYTCFFDFDNTVTQSDVLRDFIARFAVDDGWERAERKWRNGKTGSRECLDTQLRCLRVTRRQAEKYLEGITTDPAFSRIVTLLRSRGTEPVILSDSFYFLIDRVLKNSGIEGVKVFSNQARFHKDRILPYFSDRGRACDSCANCKKRYVQMQAARRRPVLFAGDGRSDLCAALCADLVFAKGDLAGGMRRRGKQFVRFDALSDVYSYLGEMK